MDVEPRRGVHDVLHALEMLDVDGGHDGDLARENFVYVLPALLVLRAGRICVRQLVDDDDVGLAGEDRVEVHLLDDDVAIGNAAARDDFEVSDARGRIRAAVRFDKATTTSTPARRMVWASSSMRTVLPTPAAMPM